MKDFITIISLLIAFLAVIVGPFISWIIAKKQAEVSIRMARRNTIAPMRQQWINDLRTRIAEVMSISHYFHIMDEGDDTEEGMKYRAEVDRKMLFPCREIELMLNPIEQDHKQLLDHLNKITFGMNRKEMILKYESNMVRTTQLAQKIFKDEWIRVKEEF